MNAFSIVALIPVDTSALPDVGVPIPKPSIEHTLMQCPWCGRDAWIGPAQRIRLIFGAGSVARCYICIYADVQDGVELGELVMLDATASEKPRRT